MIDASFVGSNLGIADYNLGESTLAVFYFYWSKLKTVLLFIGCFSSISEVSETSATSWCDEGVDCDD